MRQQGKRVIAACRGEQRHACRKAIVAESGRNRNRREIEQVGEIGVCAEHGVHATRRGFDVGARREIWRSGDEKSIDPFPDRRYVACQVSQSVDAPKGVGSGERGRAAHDVAHHGIAIVGMGRDEAAEGRVAFGEPGPVVEQCGHFLKRRKGNRDDRRPQSAHCVDRARECGGRHRIAGELERLDDAHARLRCESGSRNDAAAISIIRIEGCCHAHRTPAHAQIGREDGDAIERAACRHHAASAYKAGRRLEANRVGEAGGYATRSCRVGTE